MLISALLMMSLRISPSGIGYTECTHIYIQYNNNNNTIDAGPWTHTFLKLETPKLIKVTHAHLIEHTNEKGLL